MFNAVNILFTAVNIFYSCKHPLKCFRVDAVFAARDARQGRRKIEFLSENKFWRNSLSSENNSSDVNYKRFCGCNFNLGAMEEDQP